VSATEAGLSVIEGGIAVVSPVPVVKVLFGTAAAKFTVVSATKITATVPAGTGKVAVTVTTPLGTASGQFAYTA
jgi:hypothetical protein